MHSSFHRKLVAATAVALASGLLLAPPAHAADDVTINLVAVNDFHGRIDDKVVQWAATVEQLLADGPSGNTLLLSAGDNVGESSPASRAQNDDPAIDVLNLLGVDASAVGNHEFDKGYSDLVNHIMARADFPILGANVRKADGSRALEASTTYTVDGIRIAAVGAVTEETPSLVEPTGIAGLTFGDPVTAINTEVDRLNGLPSSEKPDIIVAMIHDGAPWGTWSLEGAMAQSGFFRRLVEDTSPDVDAIFTGHTHNTYVYDAPVPGDPTRTRPMIQTGFHGANVGQVKLTVDGETGEVKAYTARNVERLDSSDSDLISTYPKLSEVAQIRDDAVAFAAAQTQEATSAKEKLAIEEAKRDQAYADAEAAKKDYEAAVAKGKEAYADAAVVKQTYDAAVAAGQAAYARAATIKQNYDAAAAEGKDAYARAATIKQDYSAAAASGAQAYARAATVKDQYLAAAAEGKAAYARAAGVKDQYLAASAAGKDAYARAATIKQGYDAAAAEGKAAYALAADLKQQYLTTIAIGDPDSNIKAAALAQQYVDAIAAATEAYARANAMKSDYDSAIAAGNAAYASANAMKADYDSAIAAGNAAYARANGMKTEYDSAIAAGNAAYALANGMKGDYDSAIAAGTTAYARANAMKSDYDSAIAAGYASYASAADTKSDYDAAIAAGDAAYVNASLLEKVYNDALALLNGILDTVRQLKEKLALIGWLLNL